MCLCVFNIPVIDISNVILNHHTHPSKIVTFSSSLRMDTYQVYRAGLFQQYRHCSLSIFLSFLQLKKKKVEKKNFRFFSEPEIKHFRTKSGQIFAIQSDQRPKRNTS